MSKQNDLKIDEDLLYQIKGIIEVLIGTCNCDNFMVEPNDMYFVLDDLRKKYWRLLIQIGFMKKGEAYSGKFYTNDIMGPIEEAVEPQ